MVFRTNGSSDQWQWQWAVGPSTWHHYVYNSCRSPKGMSNRRDAIGSRQDTSIIDMHRAHFTPCSHGVYIVHTLPVRVLREVVKMSSAFPRPTISAANGCAIIAAFPLNRLHHRMRPIDADRVYTSTGQVALTILLENGDPMLIVELTRLLLQWLCLDHAVQRMADHRIVLDFIGEQP